MRSISGVEIVRKIPAPEVPLLAHQAANLAPLVSLQRGANLARDHRNFFQVLRHAPVAIDVPLENFPVVDAVLPRLARVAKHEPPFEFVEVATERLAPLAARARGQSPQRRRMPEGNDPACRWARE